MLIRFLGAHNAETLSARLAGILIDGVIALDAGSLCRSLTLEEQQRLQAVLLTHRHLDHVRDLPFLGMNNRTTGPKPVYASASTVHDVLTHLVNGALYPRFDQWPSPEQPALAFFPVEPFDTLDIAGYQVKAVPVPHNAPNFGYQVTSPQRKSVFYTGDTGGDLEDVWPHIRPDLFICEVTFPNRMPIEGHLTPEGYLEEMAEARQVKRDMKASSHQ